jgi:hypothetical protein
MLAGSVVGMVAISAPASADELTGRDFGRHVSEHAQKGHFDGDHNPGRHQGFAGWDEHEHDDEHG